MPSVARTDRWSQAPWAAVLSAALLGAALVHALVVREHLDEWAPAGTFFLALVLVEALLGVQAWRRPNHRVLAATIVTSTGTLAVWTVSRTLGLPFGPAQFRTPEAVGAPDLVCGALELLAVGVAVLAWWQARRPETSTTSLDTAQFVSGCACVLVVLVTAWVAIPLVAPPASSPVHGDQTGHHLH